MLPVPASEVQGSGIQVQKSQSLWGTHLRLRGQWEAVADKPVRKAGGLARARVGGMESRGEKHFEENLARLGDPHPSWG